jgi:hypothetical protein
VGKAKRRAHIHHRARGEMVSMLRFAHGTSDMIARRANQLLSF